MKTFHDTSTYLLRLVEAFDECTYYVIHHNMPTVYSKTMRCVFCNTATGGQAPVVGFCNTPTGGLKVRFKRVFSLVALPSHS